LATSSEFSVIVAFYLAYWRVWSFLVAFFSFLSVSGAEIGVAIFPEGKPGMLRVTLLF